MLLCTNSLLQQCLRNSNPLAWQAEITREVLQGFVVGLVLAYPQTICKGEQTDTKICKEAGIIQDSTNKR